MAAPLSTPCLRIAVCNVQNGIGTTRGYWHYLFTAWKYRYPHGSEPIRRAAAFLKQEQIDLAALCEVGGGARRTRGTNQVALLAEESGMAEFAFFPTLVHEGRINQGNAVCSCFPIRRIENHRLPGSGEPRFLSEAEVMISGTPVRLLVTHLSLQLLHREKQIHHIADLVGHEDRPTILAGDFNVTEDAELDLLAESILQKAASAPTFPSWRPRRHLDYLFFSRHFTLQSSYAFDAFLFSDHLPFVAEVTLNKQEA